MFHVAVKSITWNSFQTVHLQKEPAFNGLNTVTALVAMHLIDYHLIDYHLIDYHACISTVTQ